MSYNIVDIDLSTPRINQVYNLFGNSIKVLNATSDCFIQFNDTTQDPINLILVDEIKVKFTKFYISNVGVENKSIKIVVSENFNLDDRISITDYIKAPIPEPIPDPTPEPIPDPTPTPTQIINITNPEPNVQIELNLNTLNFSEFTDNGSNIRITDDNNNPIPFYLESFNKTAMTGKLFFKTPANIINSAIIFPADLNAPSVSNGDATFEFFDDFTGAAIDSTKWNIVDATGWSVINGELRGGDSIGKLLSHKLFSAGVILEIKARTVTPTTIGHTIGGFWVSTSNGFTIIQYQGDDWIRNNAAWSNMGSVIPEGNINFLQQFTVSPTTVNLKVTQLDTNVVTYNVVHTNPVINEPILIGRRADQSVSEPYEAYWDWIRVRKVTLAAAVIV